MSVFCDVFNVSIMFVLLQVGDRIGVIEKYESGVWCGMINDRVGMFKFVHTNKIDGTQHRCSIIWE